MAKNAPGAAHPAIPPLITKLCADSDDWINEQCTESLSKIGGDEVVQAIAQQFDSTWDFRLYATSAMENIRSPQVAAKALELYATESQREGDENESILTGLLQAGLNNLSPDAIEAARQLLLRERHNALRGHLVGAAMLMGISFPELEQWQKQSHEYRRDLERQAAGFAEWKAAPSPFQMNPPEIQREPEPPPEPIQLPKPIRAAEKIGRNDPCPCGSGKKYEKCCMDK